MRCSSLVSRFSQFQLMLCHVRFDWFLKLTVVVLEKKKKQRYCHLLGLTVSLFLFLGNYL